MPLPSKCNGNAAWALYQRGTLPRGVALAGMNRGEWEKRPKARGISRHYTEEDHNHDRRLCARGY